MRPSENASTAAAQRRWSRRLSARRLSSMDPSSVSISSGPGLAAALAAISPSTHRRSSHAARTSSAVGVATRLRRCSSCTTSPSRVRRMSASRTGVLEMPMSADSWASTSGSPGRSSPLMMPSRTVS
jgi:hypothetical protein